VLACRGGEDQPEGVGPGRLLGAGFLNTGGELFGERVTGRGGPRVDGLAGLAVLGCLDEQVPGDFDHLVVHGDDPGVRADLRDCEGGQLAPAQAAVGSGVGHQLVAVAVPPRSQCPAEPATSPWDGI
jgi:hypothetical protein